jgi:ribosome recycling factor
LVLSTLRFQVPVNFKTIFGFSPQIAALDIDQFSFHHCKSIIMLRQATARAVATQKWNLPLCQELVRSQHISGQSFGNRFFSSLPPTMGDSRRLTSMLVNYNSSIVLQQRTTTTAFSEVRRFSGRSGEGYAEDEATPRRVKYDTRHRQTINHMKKVDENKKKRSKLHASKKANDDDDEEEDEEDEEEKEDADDDDQDDGGESGPVLPDPKKVKERMMNVVSAMEKSMQSLRGAEPTPELLETIRVQVYGEFMALSSVAQVVIVSATLAHVSCFDPSTVKDVRAALTESALDLNPHVDESDEATLVVPLPRLSLETRQKMVQQLNRQAEASRLKIRRIRQKAIDVCNKGKQGKLEHIGKDDAFRISKDVESATQDAIAKLNAKVDQKSRNVLQV